MLGADAYTPSASVRVEQTAPIDGLGAVAPREMLANLRGAWVVPLGPSGGTLHLTRQPKLATSGHEPGESAAPLK